MRLWVWPRCGVLSGSEGPLHPSHPEPRIAAACTWLISGTQHVSSAYIRQPTNKALHVCFVLHQRCLASGRLARRGLPASRSPHTLPREGDERTTHSVPVPGGCMYFVGHMAWAPGPAWRLLTAAGEMEVWMGEGGGPRWTELGRGCRESRLHHPLSMLCPGLAGVPHRRRLPRCSDFSRWGARPMPPGSEGSAANMS